MNQNNPPSTLADHEHQTGGGSGEVSRSATPIPWKCPKCGGAAYQWNGPQTILCNCGISGLGPIKLR